MQSFLNIPNQPAVARWQFPRQPSCCKPVWSRSEKFGFGKPPPMSAGCAWTGGHSSLFPRNSSFLCPGHHHHGGGHDLGLSKQWRSSPSRPAVHDDCHAQRDHRWRVCYSGVLRAAAGPCETLTGKRRNTGRCGAGPGGAADAVPERHALQHRYCHPAVACNNHQDLTHLCFATSGSGT